MLRRRIPKRDDRAIFELVEKELLPYARETAPGLRVTRPELRRRLRACTTYVELTAGRQAAGFISLRTDRERLTVDLLAVHPRHQGQGLGKRLMRYAERKAQLLKLPEIVLWVDEANERARGFYHKLGYEPVYYDRHMRCFLLTKRPAPPANGIG
ncbi:Ribosomal protein S18 acetylase RimI [Paenibacillus sp. UNCCL117]|uniref:GNAT family N-acetyltransferase n=1 Tax=unclassified Paenibacillus TaxID=185978 RepID=UPI0008863978|nr:MULTISPECIES: GNAT family N-acetyltransferase [unclassified Paenibacillus]SDE15892.1 Ribosomal protein S18 acetylase RimI [Paenibacillus sp. cl123]SFW61023.1 Ribosomal protein S18 acetylase RimI [Paenibacillus sp. UNCCL117]